MILNLPYCYIFVAKVGVLKFKTKFYWQKIKVRWFLLFILLVMQVHDDYKMV